MISRRRNRLLNSIDNKIVFSDRKIGIYLQRNQTGEQHCASDRIRGEWIAKNSDNMELFSEKKIYETVIFHIVCDAIKTIPAQIKLLDICDRVWRHDIGWFTRTIKPIDAIIVPTEELKNDLQKITDKNIFVIGDGHDIDHYKSCINNSHKDKAKTAVWFGYHENAKCLSPLINYIKSSGIKLKVISEKPIPFADSFVKWDVNTYIQEISKCDFSILPVNENYKSNNKDITSLLCGIPVAKTKQDISRLIRSEHRIKEMEIRTPELIKYNAKLMAQQYTKVIIDLRKTMIPVYTAIFGKFDHPRNDIKVFSESSADKFKLPVMNAKIYKVLSHKYFSNPILIYVDGNIFLNTMPQKIVDHFLKDADMAVFKHPWRNCIYKEHEHAIKRVPEEHAPLMDAQIAEYKKQQMPANFGLAECGMIIQRNNDVVQEFKERWWAEICRYTNRDQISFPYIWWQMKDRIKIHIIDGNVRMHEYFKYIQH